MTSAGTAAQQPARIVVENPLSGERITIPCVLEGETVVEAEAVLEWELVLAPGGRVPSSHAHPAQEECFTVLAGQLRFRVGRRRVLAGPGTMVRVPPGTVHHFANPGREPAVVAVTTSPALRMRDLLVTAAELAQEQHAAARALPRLLDLALFMREFEHEVRAPYLPASVVRAVLAPLAALARRRGLGARYAPGGQAPGGQAPRRRRPASPGLPDSPGMPDGRLANSP